MADVEQYGREETIRVVRLALKSGVDAVQIQGTHISSHDLAGLTSEFLSLANATLARVIVKGRLDVALAMRAHGIVLGERDLHPEAARELALRLDRKDFLIGTTAHNKADVARASAGTADYVLYGPVFDSPDEERFGAPVGADMLAGICAEGWVSVIATGGISPENVGTAIEMGAAGTACSRAIFESDDPARIAKEWVEETRKLHIKEPGNQKEQ
ncbi:thiamine phosphate synthase [Candidatus Zixiibacteriota bacterium]